MTKRDIVAAAAGAVVATVLAGGAAWAAIPDAGGVIQGCYDSGGNVKVVAALPCPKGSTPFQWNVQGLPGPQGLQGLQGTPGPKGDTGQTGATGPQGERGPQGEQGIQGLMGDKGEQGLQGIQGPQGAQGPKGDAGETGPAGPAGPGGLSGYEIVRVFSGDNGILAQQTREVITDCPPGKKVLGGGVTSAGGEPVLVNSAPLVLNTTVGDSWKIALRNVGLLPTFYTTYAVCASVG